MKSPRFLIVKRKIQALCDVVSSNIALTAGSLASFASDLSSHLSKRVQAKLAIATTMAMTEIQRAHTSTAGGGMLTIAPPPFGTMA